VVVLCLLRKGEEEQRREKNTVDHKLGTDKTHLFFKIVHVSTYTANIRYAFVKALKKNHLQNVTNFYNKTEISVFYSAGLQLCTLTVSNVTTSVNQPKYFWQLNTLSIDALSFPLPILWSQGNVSTKGEGKYDDVVAVQVKKAEFAVCHVDILIMNIRSVA
jgi:hypothetical protein